MIKYKSKLKRPKKLEVDLTGPEGNAFVLLGYARQWAKQLGKDPNPILTDMQSSDYEHLVNVLDREFGNLVDFLR